MKKTAIIWMVIIGTIVLMAGCNDKSKLQDTVETAVEAKTDIPIIEEVTIEKAQINIKYPKIVNLDSDSIADKWNKIIEDRITSDLELLADNDQYNLSYEVASNTDEKLSLKLIGSCYYDGAKQPYDFMYTYNISLSTGESIRLCDQTDINNVARNIYSNTGFTIEINASEKFKKYILSAFDNEDSLTEMLLNFDYCDGGEQPYGYSYYEDDKLYLCIEVPHDLGDYIIIVMDTY
ncbi:MAG: hypothetical protein ACERKZ_19320 [Lachnotalea sp.]